MSTLTTGTYEKYGASYKTLTLTDGEYAFTVTPETVSYTHLDVYKRQASPF